MRYTFGTEVGISINKIYSHRLVGLEDLMIHKYKSIAASASLLIIESEKVKSASNIRDYICRM
jgi:hypothetical protein